MLKILIVVVVHILINPPCQYYCHPHYRHDQDEHHEDGPGRGEDGIVAQLVARTPRHWQGVGSVRYHTGDDDDNDDDDVDGDDDDEAFLPHVA